MARPDAMLSGIRWSDDDRRLALKMHADGIILEKITAAIGCSRTTLRRWINKAKAPLRRPGFPPSRPEITGELCRRLWSEHGSYHKAAAAIGVNPALFYRRATGRSEVWTR